MKLIVLTQEQADAVRTEALQPIDIGEGHFVLSLRVLQDPEHEAQWPVLKQCDQREVVLPVLEDV